MILIKKNDIRKIIFEILRFHKINEKILEDTIDGLIWSSLRGIDSHGLNLFPQYLKEIISGRTNIKPNLGRRGWGIEATLLVVKPLPRLYTNLRSHCLSACDTVQRNVFISFILFSIQTKLKFAFYHTNYIYSLKNYYPLYLNDLHLYI